MLGFAVHLTILGLVDCPISLHFFRLKRAPVIRAMRAVFLPPLQGSRHQRVPRVPLRCTLGYDPAPLRGITALSVTNLGPGAADRSQSSNRSLTVAAQGLSAWRLSVNSIGAS